MLIAATSPLLLLAVFACPIGMGLMMLFMGRGMMGSMKKDAGQSDPDAASLAEMKAEQARLVEKIEALEAERSETTVSEPASDSEPGRVG